MEPVKTDPETVDDSGAILQRGRDIILREVEAVRTAADKLDGAFVSAVRLILACRGRVAVSGVGKAGDVGKKIQSTLASTGTPSYVLHPVESLHGDLGMIQREDIALMLTKSGATQELARMIPLVSAFGCKVIVVTAKPQSVCGKLANVVIDIGNVPEACPLGMAPSSSTAAMMAVGDALALTVMGIKNIEPEQYAKYHPGGALGRSLMRVHEIMREGPNCPICHINDTLQDYDRIVHGAPKRAGAASVVDDDGVLVGFFTHGDVSRLLSEPEHPARRRMGDVMTRSPKVIHRDAKVADAIAIMQSLRIDELPVVDDGRHVVGMVDIQDLLACGFSVFDDG